MITDKQITAEVSVLSTLWDEQQEPRSTPTSSTPPHPRLHPSFLRETSASGKLETSVANHLQSKPSGECLVCRLCGVVWDFFFSVHHLARKTLPILSGGISVELKTPGKWKVAGGSGTILLPFLLLGWRGTIPDLVYFAQALLFSSGPPPHPKEVKFK